MTVPPKQLTAHQEMKKESILFASYLLGSVFAQDLNKSFGDGTLPEFLMRYDVNEDGIIDEEERQARAALSRLEADMVRRFADLHRPQP